MKWRDKLIRESRDQKIAGYIADALQKVLKKDIFLLTNDADERAISHRLAVYLTPKFEHGEWKVDCEYNRYGDDYVAKKLKGLKQQCPKADDEGSLVRPDIIIHQRGTSKNRLVIEIKKSTNPRQDARDCDLKKLQLFRDVMGYEHALFIEFVTRREDADISDVRWL